MNYEKLSQVFGVLAGANLILLLFLSLGLGMCAERATSATKPVRHMVMASWGILLALEILFVLGYILCSGAS